MPIYEYRCAGCSRQFERYVAGAATAVACPACGSTEIKRTLSVFALRSGGGVAPMPAPTAGGGCCGGGGCGCH